MPTPIDELLITVEVEQGSKLEELYKMLKEFQSLGGKLEVDVDLPEIEEMKGYVVSAHDKINDLTNILIPLVTKYPSLLESIQNLINDNFQAITKDIKVLLEWKDNLNKDVSSILTNIKSILKSIEIVSQNIDKFKSDAIYKEIIGTLNELTKNIKNIFQEQIFDEIKNKLDDLRQQIDKTYFDELKNKLDAIINKLPQALRAQMRNITNKIINRLKLIDDKTATKEEIKSMIDGIYIPSGRGGLSSWEITESLRKALEAVDIKSVYEKTIKLLNTIKTFVHTGGFTTESKYFEEISNYLDSILLEIKIEVALKSQSTKILEEIVSLKVWLDEEMARRATVWNFDSTIGQMQDTIEERIPKKGGWRSVFGKAIETELEIFKEKLDENLRKVLGEELDDWKERTEAMKEVGGGDLPQELQFINKMLNEVAQLVVADWIEELGTLTRQMLQINEDFGEKIFEKMSKMGGDWNTLLHNYLRQEIKIDRFTNLLGKKIIKEAEEFSSLREFIQNFDIPEKFEVLHEKIDNLREILGVPGGLDEILGSVDYIWEKIQRLLNVLRKNDKILQVLKEVPDIERMGPVAESLEALMKILSTAQDVREALLMWRVLVSGARGGLRNISHVSQIVETKRVLELEKITRGSRVEDISEIIENQIIRPYFPVWKKIDKNVEIIERKIEEVKTLEEQNMDKDSLNKTKLSE